MSETTDKAKAWLAQQGQQRQATADTETRLLGEGGMLPSTVEPAPNVMADQPPAFQGVPSRGLFRSSGVPQQLAETATLTPARLPEPATIPGEVTSGIEPAPAPGLQFLRGVETYPRVSEKTREAATLAFLKRKEAPPHEPFAKPSLQNYTTESIKTYTQTGDINDLVEKPAKSGPTPESVTFEKLYRNSTTDAKRFAFGKVFAHRPDIQTQVATAIAKAPEQEDAIISSATMQATPEEQANIQKYVNDYMSTNLPYVSDEVAAEYQRRSGRGKSPHESIATPSRAAPSTKIPVGRLPGKPIGTYQGKPVYLTPDGKRMVEQ